MPLMGVPIEEVTSENESNVNSVFNDAATALTNDTGFSMITDHEPSAPLGTFLQQQSTFSTLPDPSTLNFNSQAAGFMPQSAGEAFSQNPNPSISIPVSAQSQLQPPLMSPLHCQTSAPAPAERTGAPVVTFSNGKPQVMLYDPNPHTPTPVASHEPSPCSNCVESSSASGGSASGPKGRRSRCCSCGLLCSLFLATIALVNLISPLAMLALARLHVMFVPRPPESLSNETSPSSSPSSSFASAGASRGPAPALAEFGSELLTLGLKLVLLASLACALYARRSRASLPRTPPLHALVVLLFTLLPLPFWLLWLLGLPQPHSARDPFPGTSTVPTYS